jgi:hypothetical protein
VNEQTTVELSTEHSGKKRAEPVIARMWRGLSGSLAVGLVLLALGVIAVQVYAGNDGLPGPGAFVVVGHVVAAVLAVIGQAVADRRTGWFAALACFFVLVVVAATMWIFWWA